MPVTQPNYTALLQNDPILQALLRSLNTQGLTAQSQLTGAQQQTLARLGETIDPSLLPPAVAARLGNLGAALTPELAGLVREAGQAGVSTLAQLADQYRRAQSASVGDLGARGIVRSGAYGQHSADNLARYQLSQYQARQGALDQLAQLQQGYLGTQGQLAQQAATGTNDALQRIGQQIAAGQIGAGPTPSPAPKPKPAAPTTFRPSPRTPGVSGARPLYY